MELLNVIIDYHAYVNEVTEYKQSSVVLVNSGIISRYVPEFDLYINYRRQNVEPELYILEQIRDSNGILFPSYVTISKYTKN
jgi:hypothetical protein